MRKSVDYTWSHTHEEIIGERFLALDLHMAYILRFSALLRQELCSWVY